MKARWCGNSFVCLILALAALATVRVLGQNSQARTDKNVPLELQEILSKLTFTSRINHSFEELNEQLVVAVRNRGVNFIVSDENRQAIRKAGGNDALIKAIDIAPKPKMKAEISPGISPEESRRLDEENRLYQIVLKNFRSRDPETLQKAIDAAKEFLRRFGDDPRAKPQVDWMRPKIPIWENLVQRMRPGQYNSCRPLKRDLISCGTGTPRFTCG